MIFQDPSSCLNPLFPVGYQLVSVIRAHSNISKRSAKDAAVEALASVGFPDPSGRLGAYPFELSGGLRQRVMIAMAIACRPTVLLADEPTTNLDVSIQAQILDLIRECKQQYGFAVVFVSHDIGVVASIADRVAIMYAGRIVETGPVRDIVHRPLHPYTQALMGSAPSSSMTAQRSRRLLNIPGVPPDPGSYSPGCAFADRCERALDNVCNREPPPWVGAGDQRGVECHWVSRQLAALATGEC